MIALIEIYNVAEAFRSGVCFKSGFSLFRMYTNGLEWFRGWRQMLVERVGTSDRPLVAGPWALGTQNETGGTLVK